MVDTSTFVPVTWEVEATGPLKTAVYSASLEIIPSSPGPMKFRMVTPTPPVYVPIMTALGQVVVEASKLPGFNIGKLIAALFALVLAFTTNPAGIPLAIAALIAALTGP